MANKDSKPLTTDPRFSKLHDDPRFNIPKRKALRGDIDSRFKTAISSDKGFQDEVTVDKYGRKVKKNSTQRELKKYYNLDDDDDKNNEEKEETIARAKKVQVQVQEPESESEEESTKILDRARGEGQSDEESSGSDSEDEEDSSEDEEEDEIEEEGLAVEEKNTVPLGEETSSFAVVNLDWDNVRAVDLMMTFSSFANAVNGRVLSVKILPSEYGKARMADEELHGPNKELFKKKSKKKNHNEEEDDEEEDEINEKTIIKEDLGEEVDSSTLRKYQLQRLRYYYAVVQCDSINTAKHIYDTCDGTEYESTANFFDLRYIPEDMEFDDEPHDECDKMPADYRPNTFVTDALQHSKVRLTWDETPRERLQVASRAFSQKEIDEMDFKAYLASDSESEDDFDKEDLKSKYKSLLGTVLDKKKNEEAEENDNDEIDMEITFTPGIGENKDKQEVQSEENENIREKYIRKEKERKMKRMEKLRNAKKELEDSKPLTKKQQMALEAKKQAELELLMMDDDLLINNKPKEKSLKKKDRKGKKQDAEEADAEAAEATIADPRFQDLYEDSEFAIDTTAPQFKKTKAMEKTMQERLRRQHKKIKNGVEYDQSTKKRKTGDASINQLVEKLKKRAKR